MKAKELIVIAGVLVALGFAYSYASGARADAVAAEERVHVLEAERIELERLNNRGFLEKFSDKVRGGIASLRGGQE